MYNVKELREKLDEKISSLGIDPKFKENPAYKKVLDSINDLIGQMNMSEQSENVLVSDYQGRISFDWASSVGDKYSFSLTCSSPETIDCIVTTEKKPYYSTDGKRVSEKNAVEQLATIDKTTNYITLNTNTSMLNDYNCTQGKCNNYNGAERKLYTSDGVMSIREHKGISGELIGDVNTVRPGLMLESSRRAYDGGIWSQHYNTRMAIVRTKLDTARVVYEDKYKGINYNATMPLNQEHGLQDMSLLGGYDPYPEEVEIPPLSKEEIAIMISKEPNEKVREGLMRYAAGRDTYSYSSINDPTFVRTGLESNTMRK